MPGPSRVVETTLESIPNYHGVDIEDVVVKPLCGTREVAPRSEPLTVRDAASVHHFPLGSSGRSGYSTRNLVVGRNDSNVCEDLVCFGVIALSAREFSLGAKSCSIAISSRIGSRFL